MFDPFVASDPPVLVHEIDSPEFEHAWSAPDSEEFRCPVCGEGLPKDRGVSAANDRPWIRFSCGDVVAQEITAG